VIRRARIEESLFRHTSRGREPLAPPGEGGHHVHYQPTRRVGIGSITSSKKTTCTFWELLAFELGCNIATAKKLYEEGLIQ
jgi:hypothetical protein